MDLTPSNGRCPAAASSRRPRFPYPFAHRVAPVRSPGVLGGIHARRRRRLFALC